MSRSLLELPAAKLPSHLAPENTLSCYSSPAPDDRGPSRGTLSSGECRDGPDAPELGVPAQPQPPQRPEALESPIRSSCWHENLSTSSDHPGFNVEATTKHAVVRERYAHERNRFLRAQEDWMDAMEELCPSIRTKLEHHAGFARLDQAFKNMQNIAPLVRIYDDALNNLDIELQVGPSHPFAAGEGHTAFTTGPESRSGKRYPDLVVDLPATEHSSSDLPELADLYYEHASAVRYLSDDLINLGPRPSVDAIITTPDGGSVAPNGDSTTVMAAYEYAERHLQLLKDIENERAQAAHYKALCLENNIKLEDDPEAEADDQSEDMYQSLLYDLEYGPSRLESFVAVNQGPDLYTHSMLNPQVALTTQDLRITNWVTQVASQSQSPMHESPSLIDNEDYHARVDQFLRRRPSRRRSISLGRCGDNTSRDTDGVRTASYPHAVHNRSESCR